MHPEVAEYDLNLLRWCETGVYQHVEGVCGFDQKPASELLRGGNRRHYQDTAVADGKRLIVLMSGPEAVLPPPALRIRRVACDSGSITVDM